MPNIRRPSKLQQKDEGEEIKDAFTVGIVGSGLVGSLLACQLASLFPHWKIKVFDSRPGKTLKFCLSTHSLLFKFLMFKRSENYGNSKQQESFNQFGSLQSGSGCIRKCGVLAHRISDPDEGSNDSFSIIINHD